MRTILALLAVGLAAVAASPTPGRIVGGSVTSINQYPMAVSMLYAFSGSNHRQACGGSILNNRSVLSAAHCTHGDPASRWRMRVGSTNANSGGLVLNSARIINHPQYNTRTTDNDVCVIQAASNIGSSATIRPGNIAGANYNLPDNAAVWAMGWGRTSFGGQSSEALRHVQIWVVNQAVCRQNYASIGGTITDNMLCSGWINVGGRDQCQGDSGGPLLHNNVIVGVCSWGHECARPRFPGVNARVSRYTNWIRNNA
ncbi:trypsin, alkaline A-like [Pararge aegeria]|uniref:trypsin n=1 Tax=Pararge aegeria aegeria TaxID=348720 RepID=A0A8S4SNQ6_9NEOP|nr:trypsin, alkaline A-like [Pararge aegeria]CAH2267890.1 jg21943 [Pararge aegeria aegeria]